MGDQLEVGLLLQVDNSLPDEERDMMVRSFMSELRAYPSISIDRAESDAVTPGAKNAGELTYQILVGMSSGVATALVPPVFATVHGWLRRQPSGTKVVVNHKGQTLEISGSGPFSAEAVKPFIQTMLAE